MSNSNSEDQDEGDRATHIPSEEILREGIFTVYFPTCKPLMYELFLTPNELILEEYDESGYESDCDAVQERFFIEDVYGFHIVQNRKEEPSVATVYFCIAFYTLSDDVDRCRKRVLRIFEVNQSQNSYEENLDIAKEWALDIENLLKAKCPNLYLFEESHANKSKNKIENLFRDLKAISRDKKDRKMDLEFSNGDFYLRQSILFVRHVLVIVNPVSGQGKSVNIFQEQISPILVDCGIQMQLVVTEGSGHALSVVSTIDLKSIEGIVAVGGDGLVNEVVNGLRSRKDADEFSHIPIGVIATGSGNGLARSIAAYYGESQGYRTNPVLCSALAVARGCISPVNLAEVQLDEKVFYSILSVGWGLISDIDIESEVLRAIGEFRFVIWSFIRLAKLRRYNAELSYVPLDSGSSINSRVMIKDEFVSVYSACQSHIGSDMMFAPDAKPCDATIHLTYLPSCTGRVAAAKFLAEIQRGQGQHINVNPVKYVKVKEFTIRCEGGIQGILTVDGEQVGGEEITVKLSEKPLLIFSSS